MIQLYCFNVLNVLRGALFLGILSFVQEERHSAAVSCKWSVDETLKEDV